jgi:hypothetical protein
MSPLVTTCPGIPPGTGFLFFTFYDSQGYGGGIPTRLHSTYSSTYSIPTKSCCREPILALNKIRTVDEKEEKMNT